MHISPTSWHARLWRVQFQDAQPEGLCDYLFQHFAFLLINVLCGGVIGFALLGIPSVVLAPELTLAQRLGIPLSLAAIALLFSWMLASFYDETRGGQAVLRATGRVGGLLWKPIAKLINSVLSAHKQARLGRAAEQAMTGAFVAVFAAAFALGLVMVSAAIVADDPLASRAFVGLFGACAVFMGAYGVALLTDNLRISQAVVAWAERMGARIGAIVAATFSPLVRRICPPVLIPAIVPAKR